MRSKVLSHAGLGLVVGCLFVWGGYAHFESLNRVVLILCALGSVVFAILGATFGAIRATARDD
jgi:4-hydroxybenzoate polyprenyltransferase